MSLAPGTRLGPYEIVEPLGVGGMGEVYRARDSRLNRTVAIKVLPAEAHTDETSRARLDREARAIAALNHPHICTLHDVGHQDGTDFLVMEYLEGQTLAARLAAGPLEVGQAIGLAAQIADALDAAHRHGIVHRDLKPANIMLVNAGGIRDGSGQVKILDFGLAKLRIGASELALSSPVTMSSPLTGQGRVMGTLPYMAPEQLEGKDADPRTDIFAFGAVLYEMLAGRRAFDAKTQASLIAAIMQSRPAAIETIRADVPPLVNRLIDKCLAKNPDERWQSAADLASSLRWISETVSASGSERTAEASGPWRAIAAIATVAAAALAVAVGMLWFTGRGGSGDGVQMRLNVVTPSTSDPMSIALSPDGQNLAFIAERGGQRQIWIRRIDNTMARPLAGTDGASFPFWSPGAAAIGFFANGQLKRINVSGGQPQTLADAIQGRGGTWNGDDVILFTPGAAVPPFRVGAGGGEAARAMPLGKVPGARFPQFLPDGQHFLFYAYAESGDGDGVYVGQLGSPEPKRLFSADSAATFVAPNHLWFVRRHTLLGIRFDPQKLETIGEPFPLIEPITESEFAAPVVTASHAGMVAYREAGLGPRLKWFDRAGRPIKDRPVPDAEFHFPELSRDGRRVALVGAAATVRTSGTDIWLADVSRGVASRLTYDGGADPVWSPDGTRIALTGHGQQATYDLYLKAASGTADAEPILVSGSNKYPTDWSSDGRFVLFNDLSPSNGYDVWAVGVQRGSKPFRVVGTHFEEREGRLSPGGHWIAYQSNESGRFEVYLTQFPGPGARVPVSTAGGVAPRWRQDGKELYFLAPDGTMMGVPVRFGGDERTVEVATPTTLFPTRVFGRGALNTIGTSRAEYAVSPDGQSFFINTDRDEAPPPITVILNWKPPAQK